MPRFAERFFVCLVFLVPVSLFWAGSQFSVNDYSAPIIARKALYRNYEAGSENIERVYKVLFSPDDDVTSTLVGLIESEKESILGAQYILSDRRVADALINARLRGVSIEIVFDRFCVNSPVGKAKMLSKAGIQAYEYNPKDKNKRFIQKESLMHHKFFIFKNTLDGKALVCTGSFNCTKAASESNQENMIFIEDANLVDAFTRQFMLLKKRSKKI